MMVLRIARQARVNATATRAAAWTRCFSDAKQGDINDDALLEKLKTQTIEKSERTSGCLFV